MKRIKGIYVVIAASIFLILLLPTSSVTFLIGGEDSTDETAFTDRTMIEPEAILQDTSCDFQDQLDQSMETPGFGGDMGWLIEGSYWGYQSFIPTLPTLTRVELLLRKPSGEGGGSIDIEIVRQMDRYTSETIAEASAVAFSENMAWVEFDFPDVSITPGSIYRIIATGGGVWWCANLFSPYMRGLGVAFMPDPPGVFSFPTFDFCFRTYGLEENHPPVVPTTPQGETNTFVNQLCTYTTTSSDPDGDQIYYGWDWDDDGTADVWTVPLPFDGSGRLPHIWRATDCSDFKLRVMAKDEHGAESGWSECLDVRAHVDSDGDGWCNCYEKDTTYTEPNDDDTDDDGVRDSEDMDPLCDLKLNVEILRIKGDLDSGTGSDFYAVVSIWNGQRFVRHRSSIFALDTDDVSPNWKATQDIPDDLEEVPIKIRVWDNDRVDWGRGGNDWCDINHNPPKTPIIPGFYKWADFWGRDCDVLFKIRYNEWQIDDEKGDKDGYGHTTGIGDGKDNGEDTEVWFRVYLTGTGKFCDNDELTYWEEIEKYGTNPREVNHKYAIIVGVADYSPDMNNFHPDADGKQRLAWDDLPDPDNDAQDMYDLLVDECGYNPGNVWYFASGVSDGKLPDPADLDKGPDGTSNPNEANVEHALDDIAHRATDKDIVVFYYSGHGGGTTIDVNPANEGGRTDASGDENPKPQDMTDESLVLFDQEYFDDDLYDNMRVIKHYRLIVILDCCHSGGFIDDLNELEKYIILTAAWETEHAATGYKISGKTYSNGQFTGRFLEKINNGRKPIQDAYHDIPNYFGPGNQHKSMGDGINEDVYF